MKHPLQVMMEQRRAGIRCGIPSYCTANELALEIALRRAKQLNRPVLIEATANQVNQFGGYTGMMPRDFYQMVLKMAQAIDLPENMIILAGDHLGPLTWQKLPESEAMANSYELVYQYARAGFTKIHVDTSMKVADDDPDTRLSDETIARRGAALVKVAEETYAELLKENPDAVEPVYIVGSEVPIPGGSQAAVDEGVQVTKVEDFKATMETFKKAFANENLSPVWERVLAIVVQPGVEEKDAGCTEYDREKAKELSAAIKEIPDLVFEGHSTDYQTKIKLREMVEDGVAILKVGPGLTFAAREALFALSFIEDEYCTVSGKTPSNFRKVLDDEMLKNDKNWKKHYHGTPEEIALKRKYSFSDRSRYYYATEAVDKAIKTMLENLKDGCPLNLLSQFMPIQYTKVREGNLKNDPKELVLDRVGNTIDEYLYATHQKDLF